MVACGSIALCVSSGVVYRWSIVASHRCNASRTWPRRLAGSNSPRIFCVYGSADGSARSMSIAAGATRYAARTSDAA